jgi:hypothetical protein
VRDEAGPVLPRGEDDGCTAVASENAEDLVVREAQRAVQKTVESAGCVQETMRGRCGDG